MFDGTVDVAWTRLAVPGTDKATTALRLGAATQNPLSGTDDRMSWGYIYVMAETDATGAAAATVLEYGNVTRPAFAATGSLPSTDNGGSPAPLVTYSSIGPGSGPQVGVDRSGDDLPGYPVTLAQADYNLCWALCNQTAACQAWAYGECGVGARARASHVRRPLLPRALARVTGGAEALQCVDGGGPAALCGGLVLPRVVAGRRLAVDECERGGAEAGRPQRPHFPRGRYLRDAADVVAAHALQRRPSPQRRLQRIGGGDDEAEA